MKKKILFTATISHHIISFHLPYLKWFKDQGYEVHVAANGHANIPYCDKFINIGFERSPFKISNLKAYKDLKRNIDNNNYSLIHCHTPMGGVLTRIAGINSRKRGTKVVYTAHGFHFFKGAPLKNWLLYFPIEYILAKKTDVIITINKEDFDIANKYNFRAGKIRFINGVGINLEEFQPQTFDSKTMLREEYGFNEKDFILIYAGELSYRKHQDLLIDVVALLKDKIPNIKLLLAGTGTLFDQFKKQINVKEVSEQVELLGFRNDITNLMMLSDISVSSSRQEGLPVNVMESMATGLPLVVTNCRGNRDLVTNGKNGYILEIDDLQGFSESVKLLYDSEEIRFDFSKSNINKIKQYSIKNVLNEMEDVYNSLL